MTLGKKDQQLRNEITMGVRTVVIGLIMFVLELMYLPLLGMMHKIHVNGDGYYSDFMEYTKFQPMPTIFMITSLIILIGIALVLKGYFEKRNGFAE